MYIKPVGQHTPTHCNILQHTATVVAFVMYVKPVGGVCLNKATCCVLNKATRCVLDDKATCSVLVRYATPRVQKDLFCACVPCARVQTRNALLHCYVVPTATHCNTLQYTATHCAVRFCAAMRCPPSIRSLHCRLSFGKEAYFGWFFWTRRPSNVKCTNGGLAVLSRHHSVTESRWAPSIVTTTRLRHTVMQCDAVCCSVMQCVAV